MRNPKDDGPGLLSLAVAVTIAFLAFGALMLWTSEAKAQQGAACSERGAIVKALADRYGETPQTVGIQQNGSVVEVYANTDTGSWSIIMSLPNGFSCFIAAGEAYEHIGAEPSIPAGEPS